MELNKYFFEALKIRLENILRSLSDNRKAYVVWGSTTATDAANKVVLTPQNTIVSGVPATLAELLIYYKACVSHEGAHLKYTSKRYWEEACSRGPAFQHLTNIIEDGRVEAAISRDLPGAGRWLRFTNDYVIRHREQWPEGIPGFLAGLCAYSVTCRIPAGLPGKTKRLIRLAAPWVDIGKASRDTKGVLTCVEEILKIPDIDKLFSQETPPPPKNERTTARPQKSQPDKKTEDRAKKARERIKTLGEASSEKTPDKEASSGGSSEKTPDKEASSGGSSEKTPDKEASSGDSYENNPDKEASSGGSSEKTPDKKTSSGGSPEPAPGGGSSDPGSQAGPPDKKDAPGSVPPEEDSYFDPPPEEDFEGLLESSKTEILSIAKDAESLESADSEFDPTKGVSGDCGIHDYVTFQTANLARQPSEYDKMKEKNRVAIKQLVDEIRTALESRKAYDLRGLNRGRLHPGSLWKLAVADPKVFSRRHIPGDIPELAAYILLDLSGSMGQLVRGGGTRIDHAKNAACVISETCRELKIPHALTGFKENPRAVVKHFPAVSFEDADSSRIPSLKAGGDNRDGYSIRVAANKLAVRPEPRKILFVLSDGTPNALGYGGFRAIQDVRNAVLEARKKGIRVISLQFGSLRNESDFKFMYDTPVFVHDTALLPSVLGSVFKRVLLEQRGPGN